MGGTRMGVVWEMKWRETHRLLQLLLLLAWVRYTLCPAWEIVYSRLRGPSLPSLLPHHRSDCVLLVVLVVLGQMWNYKMDVPESLVKRLEEEDGVW